MLKERNKVVPKNPPPPLSDPNSSQQGSTISTLLHTMTQGISFGAGSSIGHNIIDSVFTSKTSEKSNKHEESVDCTLLKNKISLVKCRFVKQ